MDMPNEAKFHQTHVEAHTSMAEAHHEMGNFGQETNHRNAAMAHEHAASVHMMAHKEPKIRPAAESASKMAYAITANTHKHAGQRFGADFVDFVAGITHG